MKNLGDMPIRFPFGPISRNVAELECPSKDLMALMYNIQKKCIQAFVMTLLLILVFASLSTFVYTNSKLYTMIFGGPSINTPFPVGTKSGKIVEIFWRQEITYLALI